MLEQSQNSAPQTPSIVSGLDLYGHSNQNERRFASASAQADALNQMAINKYNNDYNYWLWQQQTAYNSPVEQRRRLEEAGLNPNFNSIEGAGNASSPSPSQAKSGSNMLGAYQASISARAQRLNEVNAVVSGLNDLVKNIGEGFNIYKTYVTTPSFGGENGNPTYRDLLRTSLKWDTDIKGYNASIKRNESFINQLLASFDGDRSLFGENPEGNPLYLSAYGQLMGNSKRGDIAEQTLKNLKQDEQLKSITYSLKQFEKGHLQPLQEALLEAQISNYLSRTGFIDTQNSLYAELKYTGMLIPFALMLFKGLM